MLSRRKKYVYGLLALFVIFSSLLVAPVHAATFTSPSQIINLTDGSQAETYALDSWVVKNGPGDYEMWYTRLSTDQDLFGILDAIKPFVTQQFIDDLASLNLEGLFTYFADIAGGEDFDTLWNLVSNTKTIVGYATSTDGVNWTVINDEVMTLGSSVWNSVAAPRVVKNASDDYEMWFTHGSTSLTKAEFQSLLLDLADSGTRKAATLSLLESTRSIVGYATSTNGQSWEVAADDVLPVGTAGIWDSTSAGSVIKDSTSGDYEMWFTTLATDLTEEDLDSILADPLSYGIDDLRNLVNGTSSNIGYATSNDGETWVVVTPTAVSSGTGLWDSVATPSVVKQDGNYEMWFTRLDTDLATDDLQSLLDIALALKPALADLWDAYDPENLDGFLVALEDFLANQIDDLRAVFSDTSTVIAYATSTDGQTWQIATEPDVVGPVTSPWGSVALPCVVLDAGVYEMWYTGGTDILDLTFLVELLQGEFSMLRYASSTSPSIDLNQVTGWNFIGLPLVPPSPATVDVLDGIMDELQTIWTFNAATATWSYYTTISGAPQGTLAELSLGEGYWMQLISPATLSVSGTPPNLPFSISLVSDWNLISIPSNPASSSIELVLADILSNVQTVWHFNASSATWSYYTTISGAPQGGLTEMTPGNAYWIQMTVPDTLVID